MFWRFVNPGGSNIEALLSRDPPPLLEDLLDDSDLLTECKTQNVKLMEVLGQPEMVRGLLGWVIKGLEPRSKEHDTDAERQRRQRFRQLSAEVLCSEAWAITETALSAPDDYLRPFWDAILGPPAPSPSDAPGATAGAEPPSASREAAGEGSGSMDETANGTTDVVLTDSSEDKPMSAPENEQPTPASSTAASSSSAVDPAASASVADPAPAAEKEESEDEFEELEQPPLAGAANDAPGELDLVDNEREVIYGQWSRVNSHLLGKKTAEMLGFIRLQPAVVERLLANITSPAVVDLLIRIIQCEDSVDGQGVLSWLSSQNLIPRLTDLLSPAHSTTTHEAAAELIKGIIIMSAPAPAPFANPNSPNGAGGQNENGGGGGSAAVGGSRNNKFARELVAEEHVLKMVGYMLDRPAAPAASEEGGDAAPSTDGQTTPTQGSVDPEQATAAAEEREAVHTSSLVSVISIFIELIRKNNSDYSEPHLFHTLRNGLMAHSTAQASRALLAGEAEMSDDDDDAKEAKDRGELEEKMTELNASLGIVHLGKLLAVLSEKAIDLKQMLTTPRTKLSAEQTAAGVKPLLTLERFRIIELFAELLHCSNMAVLNRSVGTGPKYDPDGHLLGGLAGLDVLNGALNGADGEDDEGESEDGGVPSSGDVLKQKMMDHDIISTLFDLFFEFPLNNFLHGSVYDVVQQVLSSRLEQGLNQALIVHLFKNCGLIDRILEGQRRQDETNIRQGYMGHLILIAEDTLKFLADCPDDLKAFLTPTYDAAAWTAFVEGAYQAAKDKDNSAMGGGKPAIGSLVGGNGSALDDAESDSDEEISEQMDTSGGGSGGSGAAASGTTSEMFSRYMAQQISTSSDRQFESSSDSDDEDSEWMADRHSFQPSGSGVPSSSSRLDPFGSSAFDDDDDAWGVFQSTPSSGGLNSSDDPFGDDFATSAAPSGPHSEALAALEWNDATFQAEFRDFDSEDDDAAVLPPSSSTAGNKIHIPDAGADSDEEMSFTPTAASAQWNAFNARADSPEGDLGSPHTSTSPQSIPPSSFGSSARGQGQHHPVSPSAAAPLAHLSLSSSPVVEPFHLPTTAASIFTPMSAISPPDPSLLDTVSEHRPLGPGVGRDVRSVSRRNSAGVMESMLAKTSSEDGSTIVVPKDEIALAVEVEAEAEARQAATP